MGHWVHRIYPEKGAAAAPPEALEARMAADLEEVEAGASGAETGVAGRNAGPVQSRPPVQAWVPPRAILLAARRRPPSPADPDFLAARDERRSAPVRDRGVPVRRRGGAALGGLGRLR